MNRFQARKLAFQMIYAMQFQPDIPPAELFAASVTDRGITEEIPYLQNVFYGVCREWESLDAAITAHLKAGWKLERLAKVTLSILRLAVYEMQAVEDVPFEVAIDVAVDLAKEYDAEGAPAFINGVLNAIAEEKGYKTNA